MRHKQVELMSAGKDFINGFPTTVQINDCYMDCGPNELSLMFDVPSAENKVQSYFSSKAYVKTVYERFPVGNICSSCENFNLYMQQNPTISQLEFQSGNWNNVERIRKVYYLQKTVNIAWRMNIRSLSIDLNKKGLQEWMLRNRSRFIEWLKFLPNVSKIKMIWPMDSWNESKLMCDPVIEELDFRTIIMIKEMDNQYFQRFSLDHFTILPNISARTLICNATEVIFSIMIKPPLEYFMNYAIQIPAWVKFPRVLLELFYSYYSPPSPFWLSKPGEKFIIDV